MQAQHNKVLKKPIEAFCEAARKDDVVFINKCLDYELVLIDDRNNQGVSALDEAAVANAVKSATLLLDRGANVHSIDDTGLTALSAAVGSENVEVATLLLDRGADINSKDDYNAMPIHHAALSDDPACATLLLDRGADIEARARGGMRPLHFALYGTRPECTKTLLDRGADVNAQSDKGWAPLHVAAAENTCVCAKVLLDGGADPTLLCNDGCTPLLMAKLLQKHEMARFLRRYMRLRVLLRCAAAGSAVTATDLSVDEEEDTPPAAWTGDDVAVLWPHRDVLRAATAVWQQGAASRASLASLLGKRKRPSVQAPAPCLWPDVVACLDAWEAAVIRAPAKGTEDDVSDIIASYL